MARHPNILLILSDQHSPHIAGFAGNTAVDTRALDALAQNGTYFSAAYCQSPLCVPSRLSLWTGKSAVHCNAWDNQSVIFPEHVTLPGWLAQHGYTTAAVGKMHFRGEEQMHGFQHRPYGDLVESRVAVHQPDPPDTADGRANRHEVGRFPFAGPSTIPESMQADPVVTTESLAWLMECAQTHPDQPWFFCASYARPHFPLTAPGRYVRKYAGRRPSRPSLPGNYPRDLHPHDRFIVEDFHLTSFSDQAHQRALEAYYAAVDYVDDCIGRLLKELRIAGLLDNTIVIYTSDHGELAGEHGLWWKRSYYEASARVPLLITGDGIPANHAIDAPVELVDLFPTICDWANVPLPPHLDGESLTSLLEGKPQQRRKRFARSELLGEREEVRFRMVRDQRWKYVEFPTASPRLFDLQNDPGELHDLAANPPDEVALETLQRELRQERTWMDLERLRQVDRARTPPHVPMSNAALHYRLSDGRIIGADDHLYEPFL